MAEPAGLTPLQESVWCAIPGLTTQQALTLETLGKELSAKEPPIEEGEDGQTASLIQCRSTTAGTWEVRVAEAVGLIGVGSKSWTVNPKIPLPHLFYLLGRSHVLPSSSAQLAEMASDKNESLWQVIFDWFLRSTESLLRGDLARGYVLKVDDLAYIRGSIDTLALSRGLLRGHTQARCTYEEFSIDIPINRVLKSALARGLSSGALEPVAALRARRLLARFSGVADASARDLHAKTERNTFRYRDSLMLAIHILRGDLRELSLGTTRAWCFLWRTPAAVEKSIREVLHDGLGAGVTVTKESRYFAPLAFTPDLKFGAVAVGDVKYAIDAGKWRRGDVYQLLAFSVSHHCSHALLVNFHPGMSPEISADVAGTKLKRICWEFDRPPEEAAELLVGRVRCWLDGGWGG